VITTRVETAIAAVILAGGGWVAVADRPPVPAMVVALIVAGGAIEGWSVRHLGDDARRVSARFLFLLGMALMLSGW
jgi:hydrogenase/urease accessory protein HupE